MVESTEWDQYREIHDDLLDCYCFTKKIQSDQMTLSDFYAEWVYLKLKMQKKTTHELAQNILLNMQHQESRLHHNATVLATLFLDARYRVFLLNKPAEKQLAMNHLIRLWKRISDLKQGNEHSSAANNLNAGIEDVEVDDLDEHLNSIEGSEQTTEHLSTDDILLKLQKFDVEMNKKKREPKSNNAMDFWVANGHLPPELLEMAKVLFAAACTEVSVERNFSALAFIYNKLRCNLSEENLSDILFVRLNKDIFDEIMAKFL